MSFADEVFLSVHAGNGGSGCSSFRKEKFVPFGGPDGGDGGSGGNVVLKVKPGLQTLFNLKKKKRFVAKNGLGGSGQQKTGKSGADLILEVPAGTIVYNEDNQIIADLTEAANEFILAKGGLGGKGNQHFANSRKQAPTYSQAGLPGESLNCRLELRMIAHVGLIGLPNAGKSTLLKTLTAANTKIANYPFTTLTPNLGILKNYDQHIIIADIPGLIEGASEGVGLGNTFLKHIDRTQILAHVIDASLEDLESILSNYYIIIDELKKSPYALKEKQHCVILNKIDACQDLELLTDLFHQNDIQIMAISCKSYTGIDTLKQTLQELYKKEFL